jgi:iron complex outermembrane recepter protein
MRKSVWLLSAALIAVPSPVLAQQAGPQNIDQPQTAGPAAVADTDLEQQPVDSTDIIVTATRRNQALSDVPMAVSAVTAENLQLSGATDIRALNQLSPSLLVSSTQSEAGAGVARIRGIGTVGDNPGLESSVGVFIDGVYRSRTGMGLTELGPLERIEVLRGPQGTLFGRNTSAGLISVITALPRFQPAAYGAITIGNYNLRRLEGGVTGPISNVLAARIDGVYMKRDGFLEDVISGRDVNDRDRWLARGQLLFQPSSDISMRVIADYTRRREECCAAPYLPARDFTAFGSQPSRIAAIIRGLGGVINDDTFARQVSITPGRDYVSNVDDWGISNELNWNFGAATLASITAYRSNDLVRGQDATFNNLDILYRDSDGGSANRFKTFSQELRLQGETMAGRLDWLVGGYYSNERLAVVDNLAYGADYSRYANCLVADNFATATGQAALVMTSHPTCFNQAVAAAILPLVGPQATALSAFARLGPFAGAPFTNSGFTNLAIASGAEPLTLQSQIDDEWRQTGNHWALFTHNIFEIAQGLHVTVGARYTRERKQLRGELSDNNLACTFFATAIPALQTIPCVSPSVPGGLSLSDSMTENKLSGTAVLSYKPTPDILTYASYSRGYKAGGFNLDRSALRRSNGNGAVCVTAAQPGCGGIAADVERDLRFRPEINDAIELGMKYNGRAIDVNVALFRQLFRDFQLNTFNGLNFVVENVNACKESLGGADADNNPATGACPGGTGAGVRSQGVEVEAFSRPLPFLNVNAGVTYADTRYRDNLVGAGGQPITNALFQLPGQRVSNSNLWTVTGAVSYSPPIGNHGLSLIAYADARYMSGFNTGSDLDLEKFQPAFTVVNARLGVRGPNNAWSVELWGQNIFNQDYLQVAFDAPIQGSGTVRGVQRGFYPRSTQLFGAFLGEPRTFGVTLRAAFSPPPAAPAFVAPPPPPPPPPPAATRTCPDGTVVLATEPCPAPPPPPPPPPPMPERG